MGSILNAKPLLIDTNIIIDFLKGKDKAIHFFQSLDNESELFISTITVTELYAGIKRGKEKEAINLFLDSYSIVPVTVTLAKQGGLIKNEYGPSHNVGIADAILAATALDKKAKLVTLNLKHFPAIEQKEAPY